MRIIATEEYFYSRGYIDFLRSNKGYPRREIIEDKGKKFGQIWFAPSRCLTMADPNVANRLVAGDTRLREIDKAGISMQLLSLGGPGVESPDSKDAKRWAGETNNELAEEEKAKMREFIPYWK